MFAALLFAAVATACSDAGPPPVAAVGLAAHVDRLLDDPTPLPGQAIDAAAASTATDTPPAGDTQPTPAPPEAPKTGDEPSPDEPDEPALDDPDPTAPEAPPEAERAAPDSEIAPAPRPTSRPAVKKPMQAAVVAGRKPAVAPGGMAPTKALPRKQSPTKPKVTKSGPKKPNPVKPANKPKIRVASKPPPPRVTAPPAPMPTPPASAPPPPPGLDATDLYHLGESQLRQAKYAAAISSLTKSQQLRASPRTLTKLGQAYFDAHQLKKAESVLRRAGNHAPAMLMLGTLYQQTGQQTRARQVYKAFLARFADHRRAGWVRTILQAL